MLNQRQLLVASQLFVATGRAGHPFDLAKFSNDMQYALATLASLREHVNDPSIQTLIAEAVVELTSAPALKSEASSQVMPAGSTAAVAPAPTEGDDAPKRYVGRLR